MALIVLAIVPLLAVPMGLLASMMQNMTNRTQEIYENAGAVASGVHAVLRRLLADWSDRSMLYRSLLSFPPEAVSGHPSRPLLQTEHEKLLPRTYAESMVL